MPDTPHAKDNRFLVVVHDVTPAFTAQLDVIVRELAALLGDRFSGAIVPHWHGGPSGASDDHYLGLLGYFGECLLHGWTHRREERNGLISLLTGQADEFRGLGPAAIRARIGLAQAGFARVTGRPASGFLPPAWQLPIRSAELDSVRFVVRFHRVESCDRSGRVQDLATWSWDWGHLSNLSVPGGEWLARFLEWKDPRRIPCIAIHPADVGRGLFRRALRVIRQLLDRNHTPVVGSELLGLEGSLP